MVQQVLRPDPKPHSRGWRSLRGVLAPEFPLRTFLGLKLFQDGLLKVTQLILVILKSLSAFNKAALSSLWEHSLGKVLLSQAGFASLNKVWERKMECRICGMDHKDIL